MAAAGYLNQLFVAPPSLLYGAETSDPPDTGLWSSNTDFPSTSLIQIEKKLKGTTHEEGTIYDVMLVYMQWIVDFYF